jgi:hypothetical protein
MADRASKATRGRRLAFLLAGGSLLTTAAALPALAADTFSYGIDDKQRILQVDLTQKDQQVVFNGASIICGGLDPADYALCSGAGGGLQRYYSNNFAYDDARRQFYFMDFKGNLRYWDFKASSTLPVIADKDAIGLDQVSRTSTQFTANGSYYNDSFYYFIDSTAPNGGGAPPPPSPDRNKLVKFDLTFDGDNKPTGGTATKITVDGLENNFIFGDIAIDSTGKLYGANTSGSFFTLDLNQCPGASCAAQYLLSSGGGPKLNPSLQIAFDQDFQTLYGHTFDANSNGTSTEAGGWGTVDTATGIYSPFAGSEAFNSTPLRDIAGASGQEIFVPGPLPVLGAGAAFGWTRRLRRRLAQAGRSSR